MNRGRPALHKNVSLDYSCSCYKFFLVGGNWFSSKMLAGMLLCTMDIRLYKPIASCSSLVEVRGDLFKAINNFIAWSFSIKSGCGTCFNKLQIGLTWKSFQNASRYSAVHEDREKIIFLVFLIFLTIMYTEVLYVILYQNGHQFMPNNLDTWILCRAATI